MLKPVFTLIARDLRLAMRRQADIASVLFFFIIVVSLFPLGIGPELGPNTLTWWNRLSERPGFKAAKARQGDSPQ